MLQPDQQNILFLDLKIHESGLFFMREMRRMI